ncbi:hypothetical protein F5984_21885 [Rudanella paleaurantiibacter]|uniref:HTH luxR-type domain-containing protein n=1 Tax=Rudanella paleaurantiibacter TaxID=2614655 RepID=A0A7J5TVX8_9BACT|nr:helix-turn-helix transcriptional regulator [Rudanella paleaurantiibacter]KAB7727282.1 hypothetical protein F5984_21885 [Rudanella paleaurantiibacter]
MNANPFWKITYPFLPLFAVFVSFTTFGQPIFSKIDQAPPAERVRMALLYFDTCQAVAKSKLVAFAQLDKLDAIARRRQDEQLGRYGRMLRDTYAKNDPKRTHTQNAELFLQTAAQADSRDDEQIASVCEHFAGQYYYLAEDFGKGFQYLLSANRRFRQIGYRNIPEIHRYLYELAFNYYYLNDDEKVVELLTEATRYPPFNPNLHIQTYNTLAMAQARQLGDSPKEWGLAVQNYRRAYQLAVHYRDSVWIGIANGNLGGLFVKLKQWPQALNALRIDYRLVMRDAANRGYPLTTAVALARVFYELGQLDSCRYYLNEGKRMRLLQRVTGNYIVNVQDDLFWLRYYETYRLYALTTGKPIESARAADSVLKYQNRIDKRYRSKAATLAEQRLLIQQHEAEVAELNQRSQNQRLFLGMGVGLSLLVALLLGFLYRYSQARRQREAQANAQREKQLEREKQAVAAERDRAQADLALFLSNLRQLESEHHLANASLLTPDDWEEFRKRFERVHPQFFMQLRSQFNDLTPAEERLLALSKLNLHSRQMSHMLGISTDSIRKTRYRLRKKFGIAGDAKLLALLDEPATDL